MKRLKENEQKENIKKSDFPVNWRLVLIPLLDCLIKIIFMNFLICMSIHNYPVITLNSKLLEYK